MFDPGRKLAQLFRKDNMKTWAPMLGSIVGFFASEICSLFFTSSPVIFCITCGVSVFCVGIFLFLTFQYVRKWHSIIEILRTQKSLLKTCVYLAAVHEQKNINTFQLSNVDINYRLEDPVFNSTGMRDYPFCIEYTVSGLATGPLSAVYYHMLAPRNMLNHVTVFYAFDHDSFQEIDNSDIVEESKNIIYYRLVRCKQYSKGDRIRYRIRLLFDAECGIAVEGVQRILFNPRNFSVNCQNAHAAIRLSVPSGFECDFNTPLIQQYVDGLNQTPNAGLLKMKRTNYSDNTYELSSIIQLDSNQLYALEFCAKTPGSV